MTWVGGADGRRVSTQAWAIYAKIREVDALLRSDPEASARIREVHPEVCFWAWAGENPMSYGKKTREGRRARLDLAEAWLGAGVLQRARGAHLKKHLADDDILDAIAALWTASRIASGDSEAVPVKPPRDSAGLPMEIVY